MALNFGTGGGSARVNVGSSATLDNLHTASWLFWSKPTSNTGSRLMQKGSAGTVHSVLTNATDFQITVARSTVSSLALAPLANFAAYGTGKWVCLACVIDTGGADGDQALYVGDVSTPLAPPSSYTTQRVGSGTPGDDSAVDLYLGNSSGASLGYSGDIAIVMAWNRVLSREELIAQQWNPHVTSGCAGCWVLGWNGTSTQPDWSGNGNNGTVSGATVVAHVPLRPLYGGFAGWRGNYTAPALTRLSRLALLGVG